MSVGRKKCNKPESMQSASTNVNTQVILKIDIVNKYVNCFLCNDPQTNVWVQCYSFVLETFKQAADK